MWIYKQFVQLDSGAVKKKWSNVLHPGAVAE